MLLFADSNNGLMLLFLLAMGLTVATLLMRWHRYFRQRRREDARERPIGSGRSTAGHRKQHPAAPLEVDQWEVRMHETARDLMGQLDSKMSALQALILEADRAAGRLEAALSQTADPAKPLDRPSDQPINDSPGPAPTADRPSGFHAREEVCMLADYGYESGEIARRIGVPVGEVELILRLRNEQSGQADASPGGTGL